MAQGDLLWTNCQSLDYLSIPFGARTNTASHEASSIRIHQQASLIRIYPFKASRTIFFALAFFLLLNPYCLLYFSLQFGTQLSRPFLPIQKLWNPALARPNHVCSTISPVPILSASTQQPTNQTGEGRSHATACYQTSVRQSFAQNILFETVVAIIDVSDSGNALMSHGDYLWTV